MTKAGRFTPSSVRYLSWGTVWNGKCLTARILESPNPENGCILSDILIEDVPEKILPFPTANGTPLVQSPDRQTGGNEIYKAEGLSCTLTSGAGGVGGKTGLYEVGVPIKENTKQGYKMAYPGDSIDLGYAGMNTRRGRVGHQIAHTLTTRNPAGDTAFCGSVSSASCHRALQMSEYQTIRNS